MNLKLRFGSREDHSLQKDLLVETDVKDEHKTGDGGRALFDVDGR